jgi:hypothetical protein
LTLCRGFRIDSPCRPAPFSFLLITAALANALLFGIFVAHRSRSKRFVRPSAVATYCAALVSMFVAGCQSNAQYDQVARELRMQEDELYAMEDYVAQYQQLVCKYRTENAALKRQLAASGVSPTTRAPATNGTRTAPMDRSLDVTPPATDETTPAPGVQDPSVPPLEQTLHDETGPNSSGRRMRNGVTPAAAELVDNDSSAARALALEEEAKRPAATDVWLRGEVVANEAGGGPRMVVEIEPLDSEARPADFSGALSLMLTAPNDMGGESSVARWDYRPDDVRAAVDTTEGGKTIRLHLELPPDSPAVGATKMWVQLMSRRTGRLLTHSEISFSQPSLFSSKPGGVPSEFATEESPVVAAAHEEPADGENPAEESTSDSIATVSAEMFDGGWTIAKPWQPAGLPEAGEESSSEWRASLEPPPQAISTNVASRPKPRVSRPREAVIPPLEAAPKKLAKPSPWSPERASGASSRGSSRTVAARPTWSATR